MKGCGVQRRISQSGHPWCTQWSCNRYFWVVFWWSWVEFGGQPPQEPNVVWGPDFSSTSPASTRWILQRLILLDRCREFEQMSHLLVFHFATFPFGWISRLLQCARASAPLPFSPAAASTTPLVRVLSLSDFVVEICCLHCKFLRSVVK
jgi:hypothetical protein